MKMNSLNEYKQVYLIHTGFKGTVINRTFQPLHGGSLEITLT